MFTLLLLSTVLIPFFIIQAENIIKKNIVLVPLPITVDKKVLLLAIWFVHFIRSVKKKKNTCSQTVFRNNNFIILQIKYLKSCYRA